MYSSSTKSLFWAFIIFTAITIMSGGAWLWWFMIPLTLFFWLLIDMMFLQRNMFMYEPNYNFWKEANEGEY